MPERYDFTSSALNTAKLDSPSAQRNKDFIWNILSQKIFSTMPPSEKPLRILEIAAGCGVHVEHFATQLASSSSSSSFEWYPTDLDEESRKSIEGYIQDGKLNHVGVQPPLCLTLDANGIKETETLSILFPEEEAASTTSLDLMICINMIHISPWSATLGLMKLAGERLKDETGVLYCYGPYKEGGTAVESNLNFDKSLQSRNPDWGVRDLEEVCKAASEQGLVLVEKIEMPANNLSLIFRKKKEK